MSKMYSIYEAKAKLSELLRLVKSGKEVILTERGTPIARLTGLSSEENVQSKLKQLRQNGLVHERINKIPIKPLYKEKDSKVLERFLKDRE